MTNGSGEQLRRRHATALALFLRNLRFHTDAQPGTPQCSSLHVHRALRFLSVSLYGSHLHKTVPSPHERLISDLCGLRHLRLEMPPLFCGLGEAIPETTPLFVA